MPMKFPIQKKCGMLARLPVKGVCEHCEPFVRKYGLMSDPATVYIVMGIGCEKCKMKYSIHKGVWKSLFHRKKVGR